MPTPGSLTTPGTAELFHKFCDLIFIVRKIAKSFTLLNSCCCCSSISYCTLQHMRRCKILSMEKINTKQINIVRGKGFNSSCMLSVIAGLHYPHYLLLYYTIYIREIRGRWRRAVSTVLLVRWLRSSYHPQITQLKHTANYNHTTLCPISTATIYHLVCPKERRSCKNINTHERGVVLEHSPGQWESDEKFEVQDRYY